MKKRDKQIQLRNVYIFKSSISYILFFFSSHGLSILSLKYLLMYKPCSTSVYCLCNLTSARRKVLKSVILWSCSFKLTYIEDGYYNVVYNQLLNIQISCLPNLAGASNLSSSLAFFFSSTFLCDAHKYIICNGFKHLRIILKPCIHPKFKQ